MAASIEQAALAYGEGRRTPILNPRRRMNMRSRHHYVAMGDSFTIIQRLAAQYQVILVDAWTISTRSDREDWSEDGVHLNSRGYLQFAKEILKILEQQTGMKCGDIEAL